MTAPHRTYTPEELALFASYRDVRRGFAPLECVGGGDRCWVEFGPPAITTNTAGGTKCLRCRGTPRASVRIDAALGDRGL